MFRKIETDHAFTIREDSLVQRTGNDLIRVHNWADEGYHVKNWFRQQPRKIYVKPLPSEEIVQRAKIYLAKTDHSYSLLENNCEAFATLCRYGRGFSGQSIGFGWGWGGWF